jgi:histidinol-phosphate aminotransferase
MSAPFTPLAASLPSTVPFTGPEALERRMGVAFKARIGANESVFGPSPRAIAAMQAEAAAIWKYGDPEVHDLKEAIAAHHRVPPGCVTVGEGIDGLFGLAVRLFVEPGIAVASSTGAYPTFNFHVHGFGGRLVTTPYVDDRENPEALLALAAREKARVIYFANPDTPMGSWWPEDEVQRLVDAVPQGTILMLDEAYGEFAPAGTMPPLDPDNRAVLRFRTFSKAYGMAGLRVGYAIGHPEVISAFDKVRNHFGVTRFGQVGAMAALADQPWLAEVVANVAAARDRIAAIARANGLSPLPSATNFVAIDCGGEASRAKAVLDGLLARGVFVRMPGIAPLSRCIRVSAGRPADLDLFAQALSDTLAGLG